MLGVVPTAILLVPTPASATAWGAYDYFLTVKTAAYGWTNFCDRAGIVDIASNRVNMQTRANTAAGCSTAAKNVPSGYLAGYVTGYRDGAFCANSQTLYSSTITWSYTVSSYACSNPSGTQAFHTVGHAAIYDDGSGGSAVGYVWDTGSSPSQNY